MDIQRKAQKGFTLIELMIVIAIVGILAAIALPAYQDYVIRAKMSEGLAELAEAKTTVAEYVAANGSFPAVADASDFGVDTVLKSGDLSNYVVENLTIAIVAGSPSTVHIGAAVLEAVYEGGTFTTGNTAFFQLIGQTRNGFEMVWSCEPGMGAANTDPVPSKYLPANCR